MKKNLQIHVRVTPATRQQWDELNENSPFNTQSALFRSVVTELYENEINNLKTNENEYGFCFGNCHP